MSLQKLSRDSSVKFQTNPEITKLCFNRSKCSQFLNTLGKGHTPVQMAKHLTSSRVYKNNSFLLLSCFTSNMKIGLFLDDYIKDNWEKVIGHLLIIVYELMFLNYILFMCMSWLFVGFFGFGFVLFQESNFAFQVSFPEEMNTYHAFRPSTVAQLISALSFPSNPK